MYEFTHLKKTGMKDKQCTHALLMIRPADFRYNQEAADSNAFMQDIETNRDSQKNALENFDRFVDLLRNNEVEILVFDDIPKPSTPDSIFPNNWVSFHPDGTVCLYPMEVENRRLERRTELIDQLGLRFNVSKVIDLSSLEKESCFLEGTGSMVLDRVNKKAYACLSARTHERGLKEWNNCFPDYEVIPFKAVDRHGKPIYHTNVMMSVGENHVVICKDSIKEQQELIEVFKETQKEVIEITYDQMESFAGNMLQVENRKGEKLHLMSTRAFNSLHSDQKARLTKHGRIVHSELGLIETLGGGSARCMLAEIHLPEK